MVGTNAIAGSTSTGLWYSTNSGTTWRQSNKTNNNFISVYMNGTNAMAGSSTAGLWYSLNSGQTWQQSSNVTTGAVNSVFIDSSNTVLAGGANIAVYDLTFPCFNENTTICVYKNDKEYYEWIQNLQIGDFVKTYKNGYKSIKHIGSSKLLNNNSEDNTKSMYKMKNTDFIITGGHSILVDDISEEEEKIQYSVYGMTNQSIEDKQLLLACVSDKFEKIMDKKIYNIYHIVLENDDLYSNYGIYANDGILTESISYDCFTKSFKIM
jgi:hypothetical protein